MALFLPSSLPSIYLDGLDHTPTAWQPAFVEVVHISKPSDQLLSHFPYTKWALQTSQGSVLPYYGLGWKENDTQGPVTERLRHTHSSKFNIEKNSWKRRLVAL